jgi:hypothetical protein
VVTIFTISFNIRPRSVLVSYYEFPNKHWFFSLDRINQFFFEMEIKSVFYTEGT